MKQILKWRPKHGKCKRSDQELDGKTSSPRIWRSGVGCVDCRIFGNGEQQMEQTYEDGTARRYLMMMMMVIHISLIWVIVRARLLLVGQQEEHPACKTSQFDDQKE